jgi:uncharacterized membrane protein
MKWIGQQIYDLASRFRNDVFLEDISTGTIASGAHLGLDSNNKIVKAADGGGDLTSIVAGTGLSGTDLTGPIPTLNVDASQLGITKVGTLNGLVVTSASDLGSAAITLTNADVDQIALDINASNTTASVVDVNALAATNSVINLNSVNCQANIKIGQDITSTGDLVTAGLSVSQSKNVTTIASRTMEQVGVHSVVTDLGRNNGGATNIIKNLKLNSNRSYADGTTSIFGIDNVVTGTAASGAGLYSNVANDLGPDFWMVDSADTANYCKLGIGANGATTLATYDGSGAAANFLFSLDGTFAVASTGIDIAANGTITNATWNGVALADAYVSSNVALLDSNQTFTGTKTLNSFKGTGAITVTNILDEDAMGTDSDTALATQQSIKAYTTATHATAQTGKSYRIYNANFRDDIATTKHYLPLKGILEQLNLQREEVSELAVTDGRVASITLRVENIQGTHGDAVITFGIETNIAGVGYDNASGSVGDAWSVIETEALTVNHTDDEHIFHYVFGEAKHWDSTDMWAVSIESDVDMSGTNERFFITVVVEDDWSTYLAGASREMTTTP